MSFKQKSSIKDHQLVVFFVARVGVEPTLLKNFVQTKVFKPDNEAGALDRYAYLAVLFDINPTFSANLINSSLA